MCDGSRTYDNDAIFYKAVWKKDGDKMWFTLTSAITDNSWMAIGVNTVNEMVTFKILAIFLYTCLTKLSVIG